MSEIWLMVHRAFPPPYSKEENIAKCSSAIRCDLDIPPTSS